MAIDSSRLENADKKILVIISKELLEQNFNFQKPYHRIIEKLNSLDEITNFLDGQKNYDIDVEFICKFIQLNYDLLTSEEKNNEIYQRLVIPKASDYYVKYSIDKHSYETEFYKEKWSSYDENWVKPSINEARHSYTWSPEEGELVTGENYEQNYDNFQFEEINLLEEQVNKMDIEILKKLKKLIEQKINN